MMKGGILAEPEQLHWANGLASLGPRPTSACQVVWKRTQVCVYGPISLLLPTLPPCIFLLETVSHCIVLASEPSLTARIPLLGLQESCAKTLARRNH